MMDDLCHVPWTTFGSKQCTTIYCNNVSIKNFSLINNNTAIAAILSLMSADIVESLLSNVLLSGRLVNPQTNP